MRPFIIFLACIFCSCDNSSESNTGPADTLPPIIPRETLPTKLSQDTFKNSETQLYLWDVDFYNKTIEKNPNFKKDCLNADSIIKGLNIMFPDIKFEKKGLRHDTLYAEIKDSHYLGERMGTSGAALYLAQAVINLTAVEQIKYVKIDFDEGSHASPGVWNRKDFSDYKEIK